MTTRCKVKSKKDGLISSVTQPYNVANILNRRNEMKSLYSTPPQSNRSKRPVRSFPRSLALFTDSSANQSETGRSTKQAKNTKPVSLNMSIKRSTRGVDINGKLSRTGEEKVSIYTTWWWCSMCMLNKIEDRRRTNALVSQMGMQR